MDEQKSKRPGSKGKNTQIHRNKIGTGSAHQHTTSSKCMRKVAGYFSRRSVQKENRRVVTEQMKKQEQAERLKREAESSVVERDPIDDAVDSAERAGS